MMPLTDYRRVVDTTPVLCVDLLLRDGSGKYLLVKRNNEPLKGQWWVPGGRVFKGETLEQAASRKVSEELSVAVSSLHLVGYHEYLLPESPFGLKSGHHAVSFIFSGVIDTKTICLDSQSSEWGLFADIPTGFDIHPFSGPNPSVEFIAECVRQNMDSHVPAAFIGGKTRIPLNVPTYGAPEVIEALDSLMSTWVTMGKKVKAFEEMWAEYIGVPYAVMTNSGSSANLLALSCLGLKPGDEVITPALTWATTVFPIAQVGAMPVLVDVDRETYNISPAAVEKAVTARTKAIMPVHLLGNPYDVGSIMGIAKHYGLVTIEDACEAHGASYPSGKAGSFGDISTFSFFFSHHISTIEGGMVLTSCREWADELRSRRAHGWIREMTTRDEAAAANPQVDPRFLFAYPGFNFRPTEIAGAFGIHQLPRLEGFVEHRRALAVYFNWALERYQDWLTLPVSRPGARHSYFAYPITIREGAPFTKKELVEFLEAKGLETRPIESGCMALQPAMKHIAYRAGDLTNATYIHKNSFFFGLHQGIGQAEREAIVSYFDEFMKERVRACAS